MSPVSVLVRARIARGDRRWRSGRERSGRTPPNAAQAGARRQPGAGSRWRRAVMSGSGPRRCRTRRRHPLRHESVVEPAHAPTVGPSTISKALCRTRHRGREACSPPGRSARRPGARVPQRRRATGPHLGIEVHRAWHRLPSRDRATTAANRLLMAGETAGRVFILATLEWRR